MRSNNHINYTPLPSAAPSDALTHAGYVERYVGGLDHGLLLQERS